MLESSSAGHSLNTPSMLRRDDEPEPHRLFVTQRVIPRWSPRPAVTSLEHLDRSGRPRQQPEDRGIHVTDQGRPDGSDPLAGNRLARPWVAGQAVLLDVIETEMRDHGRHRFASALAESAGSTMSSKESLYLERATLIHRGDTAHRWRSGCGN